MNRKALALLGMLAVAPLAACDQSADVVARNISTAADNFEVQRRIVFVNTMTDRYMLSVEGLCSLGNSDTTLRMSVTCKVGPNEYKRHFLGLSHNVSFVVEQMDPVPASEYRYRVTFAPTTIIPDVRIR